MWALLLALERAADAVVGAALGAARGVWAQHRGPLLVLLLLALLAAWEPLLLRRVVAPLREAAAAGLPAANMVRPNG
jgi:hypothetical protein